MLVVEITIKKKVSFLKSQFIYRLCMVWLPSHHTTTSYVSPTIMIINAASAIVNSSNSSRVTTESNATSLMCG